MFEIIDHIIGDCVW